MKPSYKIIDLKKEEFFLRAKEKTSALKLVSVHKDFETGKEEYRSLYGNQLLTCDGRRNYSLQYSTRKATPKDRICFVFSLSDTLNAYTQAYCFYSPVELWLCEGYLLSYNGWLEEMKERTAKEIGLTIQPYSIFMTEVKLLAKITIPQTGKELKYGHR